ncbi:MAG TPA: DUF5666 domain-containing protein, partial [Candidatus Limnocylindrales bacterium]|nr:DUF5666 domain-containing protein [Candidatus Limnocylindrales bacterium]
GIGFVAASSNTPSHAGTELAASSGNPTASDEPKASGAPDGKGGKGLRALLKGRGLKLGLGGRIVHVTATVQDKDGKLIQLQVDHGTVQAIGGGSITVAEAGGTNVTVSTDASTLVRTGRTAGSLSDLKVGDQVFVQSRIDGGATLAKHILKVPTASGPTATP